MRLRDLLILMLVLMLASAQATWSQQPFGGTPSGAILYRNASTATGCWPGWTEMTAARGYYIVGLQSGGTVATATGTPLTNLENRPVGQHTHIQDSHNHTQNSHTHVMLFQGIATPAGGTFPTAIDAGGGTYTGQATTATNQATTATNQNTGSVAGTNAPYLELLVCTKN